MSLLDRDSTMIGTSKKMFYRFPAELQVEVSCINKGIGEVRTFVRAQLLARSSKAPEILIFLGLPIGGTDLLLFAVDEDLMQGDWMVLDINQEWKPKVPSPPP